MFSQPTQGQRSVLNGHITHIMAGAGITQKEAGIEDGVDINSMLCEW
ncbi:MAG TPA: hypothetical protein VGJ90_07885 [Methylophilaceae bacterium]|jgi:hypothetical protein